MLKTNLIPRPEGWEWSPSGLPRGKKVFLKMAASADTEFGKAVKDSLIALRLDDSEWEKKEKKTKSSFKCCWFAEARLCVLSTGFGKSLITGPFDPTFDQTGCGHEDGRPHLGRFWNSNCLLENDRKVLVCSRSCVPKNKRFNFGFLFSVYFFRSVMCGIWALKTAGVCIGAGLWTCVQTIAALSRCSKNNFKRMPDDWRT